MSPSSSSLLRLFAWLAAAVANRVVQNSPNAGGWGGMCTCPDGQEYWVGDRKGTWCGSLACNNGEASECYHSGEFPAWISHRRLPHAWSSDWYEHRLVECAPLPTSPPLPPDATCDSTVAYAFLTRDNLPLWRAWSSYFDGCPSGSALPIAHTQAESPQVREALASLLRGHGGHLVPMNATVMGDLRFRFDMVRAMLRLFGDAATHTAPNGCTPRWVVTLSDHDAPVRGCAAVHRQLAAQAGVSILTKGSGQRLIYRPERLPAEFTPLVQSSQWLTMWMAHASVLAADEEAMAARWEPTQQGIDIVIGGERIMGAFDEWVWVTELHRHGFPYSLHGLTFTVWCSDGDEPFTGYRCRVLSDYSPASFASHSDTIAICREARRQGYSFARKFGDGTTSSTEAVIGALRGEDCIAAIETAPAPPLRPLVASPPPPPPPLPPPPATSMAPVPLRMALWFSVIVGGAASILYIRFRGRPEKDEQRELQEVELRSASAIELAEPEAFVTPPRDRGRM